MTQPTSAENAIEALNGLISTTVSLISQLESVLADISANKDPEETTREDGPRTPEGSSQASIDALSLAHDSATLIKAHATKVSLFIINEPFTPTAIIKVLRELVAGPIPAIASASQVCSAVRYTQTVRRDLAWRCCCVLKELKGLVEQIPSDGNVLPAEKRNGNSGKSGQKGSIATTGVLWAACDEVIRFTKMGVAGYLVFKVEQFRDTLKDVMEELKEWGEETDDGEGVEGGEDDDAGEEHGLVGEAADSLAASHISTQAMLDSLMNSHRHIPRDDPDKIRERLDSCLRRLRLTTILYQAIVKRRLKTLPPVPPPSESNVPARLDEIMPLLKRIPERFGSLALAFYDLDPAEINRLMDQCFFDAFAVSELLVRPWDAQKDAFTDWAMKFQVEIKKS